MIRHRSKVVNTSIAIVMEFRQVLAIVHVVVPTKFHVYADPSSRQYNHI